MVTAYCTGDITPTGAELLMNETSDVTISGSNCNEVVTYTYSQDNYNLGYDYEVDVINEHIKAVREGWNNPRKVKLPNKPFLNDIRKVYRSALPLKIRHDYYVVNY